MRLSHMALEWGGIMLIDLLLIVSWIAALITAWFTLTPSYNSPAKHNVGFAAVLWLVALLASEYEVPTAYICWLAPLYFVICGFRFRHEANAELQAGENNGCYYLTWALLYWLVLTPISAMACVLHIA